jgi:hypothetical protein
MNDQRDIVRVTVDATERAARALEPAKAAAAAEAVLTDGAVIVTGAVDPALLDRLAVQMSADVEVLLRRPERAENFAPGHLQQDPPVGMEFLSAAILACPYAVQICRAVIRQPVRLSAYTNNTNLPGSTDQAVHVDEGQRWPGLSEAHPPARLTVNIPLSTTDQANGAIELWLGTHLDPRLCQFSATPQAGVSAALQYLRAAKRAGADQEANRRVGLTVPELMLAARRAERPPVRATTEAGSLIVRDPRLWHRGTPNASHRSRFMLALTYDPAWRTCEAPMTLPVAARALLRSAELDACATYVDGPIDHLDRHHPAQNSPLRRIPSVPRGA